MAELIRRSLVLLGLAACSNAKPAPATAGGKTSDTAPTAVTGPASAPASPQSSSPSNGHTSSNSPTLGASGSAHATSTTPAHSGSNDTTSLDAGGSPRGDAGLAPATAASQSSTADRCANPALKWHSAQKTNYTSYPDPGSEECVKYNGCTWAGQFAACDDQRPENWVQSHNIVAAFPDFSSLRLHDLCLRKGNKTLLATVLDTCADSDCDGCCTENKRSAEQLIDVESYTDQRWGVPDGLIEWADLGATISAGCAD